MTSRIRITELMVSYHADDSLAERGLETDHVYQVLYDSPRFFRDKEPERMQMVGRTLGGLTLTIIIEPIDRHGSYLVVTGWQSSKGERTQWQKTQM